MLEGFERTRSVAMAISNADLSIMMLRDENKNLERALMVLQYDDNGSRERIKDLLREIEMLRQELKKERDKNDLTMKYVKRQDKFIAYLKETRNSWSEDKRVTKSTEETGNGHSKLSRKRSNSIN